jgi:hypothetical protein
MESTTQLARVWSRLDPDVAVGVSNPRVDTATSSQALISLPSASRVGGVQRGHFESMLTGVRSSQHGCRPS